MRRFLKCLVVSSCLFALVACGPSEDGGTASSSPAPASSSGVPESAGSPSKPVSVSEASEEFIRIVCPADTALQSLIGTATEAGGWSAISKRDAEMYALDAADAARQVASVLLEEDWPESVTNDMQAVVDEYLATLRPLQQIAQASSGNDRSAGWRDLQGQTRPAEERVRLALKLGSMNSEKDGCPLPVKTTTGSSTKKPSPSGPDGSALGWTQHWTSPSGNIKCGYNPTGSTGTPVVACVVSDQAQLMRVRLGGIVEGPDYASSSDLEQLTSRSAATLGFGQYWYLPEFTCWQSFEDGLGMTCWDNVTRQGFAVKRDSYQFVA